MSILHLAIHSLLNRSVTVILTICAIAISITLLLGVEKVRNEARLSFANTITGVDLIVGARSGSIQLLLYSVFRIGNATKNVSWETYEDISKRPEVDWTIPLSLGDSHKGFRVLGTNQSYFDHYKYVRDKPLAFSDGDRFSGVYEAVLGSSVAAELDYRVGQDIIVTHGLGEVGITTHDDKPFKIVGILKPTGTPIDRTIHVPLEGIEAMHIDWRGGARIPSLSTSAEDALEMDLKPDEVTAFLVGLKSPLATFQFQRLVNDYRSEPLQATLPGVALQELWDMMGVAESALFVISLLVVGTGLTGMLTSILSTLQERRREMAILRSIGARPIHVLALLSCEVFLLVCVGALLGVLLLYLGLFAARPIIESEMGLSIGIGMLTGYQLNLLAMVVVAGFLVGLIPAHMAYRSSLADGMTVRT